MRKADPIDQSSAIGPSRVGRPQLFRTVTRKPFATLYWVNQIAEVIAMHRIALVLAALLVATPVAAPAADSFLDRARTAVQQAGKDVQAAAKKAGQSARDFLTDHPEL